MSFQQRPLRSRHKPRPRSRMSLPAPLPDPVVALPVPVDWLPGQVTLEELLMDHALPQIVQCRTPVLRGRGDPPCPVNLGAPLLLTSQRSARHLLARLVVRDGNGFSESSHSLVIPEDYDGYFLRLKSRTTKDRSQVQSLADVASSEDAAFLNLNPLTSFPLPTPGAQGAPADRKSSGSRERNSRAAPPRLVYTAGSVFLVDEPLPDVTSSSEADTEHAQTNGAANEQGQGGQSNASAKSGGRGSNGVMRCLDERGMSVVVPTGQAGEVMAVEKRGGGEGRLSVRSSEILDGQRFPLLARYAYSKTKPRITQFSRLFTLLDSFQETSIMGCTLEGGRLTLLEIPVSSALQFRVAQNRNQLLASPRLRKALEVCQERGLGLSRDIKFKFKFQHRVQETSQRMMKLKEDDLPSATVRTRLLVTESYVYI